MFDKLKQVRISKRARRGALLGLCLCAAAGLGTHLLLGGGAPVGCTQEDLADTRAVMAVQASVSGSTDAQSGAAADKVVYLTFDDGPSATTESVLDTLKAEGVPATFLSWRQTTTRNTCPCWSAPSRKGISSHCTPAATITKASIKARTPIGMICRSCAKSCFHMCPRTMKSNGCAFPAAAPTPSATATAAVIS